MVVDENGELIGGWAKRRRHTQRRLQQAGGLSNADEPSRRITRQAGDPLVTPQRLVTLITPAPQGPGEHVLSESGNGSVLGLQTGTRRLLQQQEQQQQVNGNAGGDSVEDGDWWAKQRYVAAIPALWDASCTLGECVGGMLPHAGTWW
jgi:hypothetical protein